MTETLSGSCGKTGGGEWTALREALGEIKELLGPDSPYVVKRSDNKNIDLPEVVRIGAIFERADEALERLETLAAAAPAPPAATPVDEPKNDERGYGCYACGKQGLKKGQRISLVFCNECDDKYSETIRKAQAVPPDCPVKGISCDAPCKDYPRCAAQDGQGAELLGPPRGGSSSDLADSDSPSVASALTAVRGEAIAFQATAKSLQKSKSRDLSVRYYDGALDALMRFEELLEATPSLPEAVAGNASAPVGEKRPSEVQHGPSCEFIKDGKGTCGPDCGQPSGVGEPRGIPKIPDAPDTRHASAEFERGVMSRLDWTDALHATYFALFKKQAPESMKPCEISHAIVDFAAREVGEGLREALEQIRKIPTMPFPDAGAHSWRAYADALYRAYSRIQAIAAAALAAPAPKPAPAADEDAVEYQLFKRILCVHPEARLSWNDFQKQIMPLVRRAAERKPPR